MEDKTLSALTALAQKLGTTAEYLWGDRSGAAMWVRFVQKKTATQWSKEAAILVSVVTIVICGSLSTTVAALVNPEYWALKQILK